MATNKNQERLSCIQLQMPTGVAIASGVLVLFGRSQTSATNPMAGVTQDAQPASFNPLVPYDSNSGYLTVDFEGVYNLSVSAFASKSPSAGAQIRPGDAIYADGGTFDVNTGITYNNSLDCDSNGTFVGRALDGIAAGQTATIRVVLRNAA